MQAEYGRPRCAGVSWDTTARIWRDPPTLFRHFFGIFSKMFELLLVAVVAVAAVAVAVAVVIVVLCSTSSS